MWMNGQKGFNCSFLISNLNFQSVLISKVNSRNSYEYSTFEKSFVEALDKHAPNENKILRGYQKPHVYKTLRSEI